MELLPTFVENSSRDNSRIATLYSNFEKHEVYTNHIR